MHPVLSPVCLQRLPTCLFTAAPGNVAASPTYLFPGGGDVLECPQPLREFVARIP